MLLCHNSIILDLGISETLITFVQCDLNVQHHLFFDRASHAVQHIKIGMFRLQW